MCVKRNLPKGVDNNQNFLCLYYTGNCSVVQGLLSQRVVFFNKILNFFKFIYLIIFITLKIHSIKQKHRFVRRD